MATTTTLMTAEEFLALPDDGVERMLIRGELRERTMTTRGYPHCRVNARLGHVLLTWRDAQPEPRGEVVVGEARVRIRHDPDTIVGIDLAYISADLAARTDPLARFIDGPPVLAVEILSPSDVQEDINAKVLDYLDAGVLLVWVVDPVFRTVTVYRPDAAPELFNDRQDLSAEPHLPGFRVPGRQDLRGLNGPRPRIDGTRHARRAVAPGPRRGDAGPPGGDRGSGRPDDRLRSRPDRHGVSPAVLGRARSVPVVGRVAGRRRAGLGQGGIRAEQIAGIGLDCTACTVVACDAEGHPLRTALLWMDQRAYREAEAIGASGDPVLRYVSGRVSPEWMLPKALWLKRNEPEVYRRADRIVECTDWLMHRLTGRWTLSLNHVAVKWNYARPDGGWPVAMMEAVGLGDLPAKWPERIVPLGQGGATLSPPRPRRWVCARGRRWRRGGSTRISGCSAWGRRVRGTWR
jgi:Uma2 family endonuclease